MAAGTGAQCSPNFPTPKSGFRDCSPELRRWNLPQVVQHKVVGYVEIADPTPATAVKKHQAGERIRVWIAQQATRTHVNAFAPRITGLRLKPVAHPLCQPGLKAVIRGTVIPECCPNATHVGIQPGAGTSHACAGGERKTWH